MYLVRSYIYSVSYYLYSVRSYIYIQSHLICIQSDLIYIQAHLICIQSDLTYIQSHIQSSFLHSVSHTVRENIVQQILSCSRFRNNQIELRNIEYKNTIQKIEYWHIYIYLRILSRTFTIHRTAGGRDRLSLSSQILRHWPGDNFRNLIFAHN